MEPSLNLLGYALPLVLLVGLAFIAVGALVVGARASVTPDAAGTPGWPLVLFAALVAYLLISVTSYVLAFVL